MKIESFDEEKYSRGDESDFYTLQQGDNKLRIVSEFAIRVGHYIKKGMGAKGKTYPCTQDENCSYCNEGLKPSTKFLCHIIDRTDGKFKLVEFGVMIMKQLKALSKDPQYTFSITPSYDINVKKAGSGLDTKYTVLPDRADTVLTEDEKKVIATLKHPAMIVDALDKKKQSESQMSIEAQGQVQANQESEVKVEDIPW